jgi:hypothetical protein
MSAAGRSGRHDPLSLDRQPDVRSRTTRGAHLAAAHSRRCDRWSLGRDHGLDVSAEEGCRTSSAATARCLGPARDGPISASVPILTNSRRLTGWPSRRRTATDPRCCGNYSVRHCGNGETGERGRDLAASGYEASTRASGTARRLGSGRSAGLHPIALSLRRMDGWRRNGQLFLDWDLQGSNSA